jgi:hypothetical protein
VVGLMPPIARRLLIAILLAGTLFARAPFFSTRLCDEEGQVATAVQHVVRGQRPRYTLARQVDGREVLVLPEHNLGGYTLPAILFAPAYYLGHADRDINSRIASVRWLRIVYLVIYGAAFALALLLLPPQRRLLGAVFLFAFSLYPLPVLASVQVQYDGAVTTFLLVASSLLLARGATERRWWLVAAAGFVLSLGKLEYLCAGAVTAALAALTLRNGRIAAAYAAGALAGLTLCAVIDWENFRAAYFVIGKFADYRSATKLTLIARVSGFFAQFSRDLWPLLAALACVVLSTPLVIREWRRTVFALAPGAAVVVAYLMFAWRGDGFPRYFAPGFILLPIALAHLYRPAWWSYGLAIVALFTSVTAYNRELQWGHGALCRRVGVNYDTVAAARAIEANPRDCMPITSWESGYFTVHAPFACWAIDAYEPRLRPLTCR